MTGFRKKGGAQTVDLGDIKMFFSNFFTSHFPFQRVVMDDYPCARSCARDISCASLCP